MLSKKNHCRTADTIVSWLEKKTGPPALALATVEEATAFVSGTFSQLSFEVVKTVDYAVCLASLVAVVVLDDVVQTIMLTIGSFCD